MNETLYIVGCTRAKIWDKEPDDPDYVEARFAYQGRGFLKALTWVAGKTWVILSGKYGFIEPAHPIGRYDIELGFSRTHPVSLVTLQEQVLQKRVLRIGIKLTEVRLVDFPRVECLNCNKTYLDIIRRSFPKNRIYIRSTK